MKSKKKNENKNKNKISTGSIFIRSFVKSFLIIASIFTIGFLSYSFVMFYGKDTEEDAIVAYKEQDPEIIIPASVDDISKNLIYCYDEETGEIHKMVLEIYQSNRKRLYYITIPVRTQYTMSDTLYRKLVLIHPYIPQVIKISNIHKFFDQETVFDYGALIVEDLLHIKLSCYTAIPESLYGTIFIEEKDKSAIRVNKDNEREIEQAEWDIPVEVFRKDYIKFLKTLKTGEGISSYLDEIYPSLQSNLSLKEKTEYLESYSETTINDIYYDLLPGENLNSAYIIDTDLTALQLGLYLDDEN